MLRKYFRPWRGELDGLAVDDRLSDRVNLLGIVVRRCPTLAEHVGEKNCKEDANLHPSARNGVGRDHLLRGIVVGCFHRSGIVQRDGACLVIFLAYSRCCMQAGGRFFRR
jgi:hypothetical protein